MFTVLSNFSMPLIRYRIGDRAAWASGPCECGRTTRRLVTVCGRENDYLLAANGTKVNGTGLTTLLYSVPGIRRFQYRQRDRDRVTLAVVPVDGQEVERLARNMEVPLKRLARLLKGVRVELRVVDEIPVSPSGKYRYVLNEDINRS